MTPRSAVLLLALAVATVTACSNDDDTIEPVPTDAPPTVATTGPPVTTPAPTEPSTTLASTTVPTTAPAETTVPPTTAAETIPPEDLPPLARLGLRDDGLGASRFGDDPDEVLDVVATILGSPTADTGWVDATFALCPGVEFRQVDWGVLRLRFGDESPFAAGERHFTGWGYGIDGLVGEEPQGLITPDGVGLGARVDELRDAYPDVQVYEGEEGLFPPSFEVSDEFAGFLSGTADTDVITVMLGGLRCGE